MLTRLLTPQTHWRLLLLIGVLGAGPLSAASSLQMAQLTAESMRNQGTWDYRLDGQGQFWLAYYDQGRQLRVRNPSAEETVLVAEGKDQAPSGLAMAAVDTGVYVLLRDKLPKKSIHLFDGTQPAKPPVELGGDTEPLSRLSAAVFGDTLRVLWYGEQQQPGARYSLYFREWDRGTRRLSDTERLLPGIYPVWAMDESGGVMVFSWADNETPKRILSRFRPAGADAFRDAVLISEVPPITPLFKAFRSGDRWFVVWQAQYGIDQQQFMLEGAWSDNQGQTWHKFGFDDLRGVNVAALNIATDSTGHIALALSGLKPGSDKRDVYFIHSPDQGTTWSSVRSLRSEGRFDAFNARNPSLTLGSVPGQVLVVWEDWREIRPRVYASLSTDYGATWAYSNVPLARPTGQNLTLKDEPNALYTNQGRFHLIAQQATDDRFSSQHLVGLDFTVADLAALAVSGTAAGATGSDHTVSPVPTGATPAGSAEETALRKRAESFWQGLMDQDFKRTYDLQDPFFRAVSDLPDYVSKMGKVKYSAYSVETIQIDGNRAEVTSRVTASVPAFESPTSRKTVAVPEEEMSSTSVWVKVDDDWYREYLVKGEDTRYTRY